MSSILPLIFSFLLITACGKHSQQATGKQGMSNVTEVRSDRLSQDIVDENIAGLKQYAAAGGDMEAELPNGRILLTEACHWSKFKVIAFLIAKKVSLDKKDRNGKTSLDYGNEDLAIKRALFPELLIELKLGLFKAAKNNLLTELKKILEENPPVNFLLLSSELGEEILGNEGDTFLTFCVKKKLENIVRLLAQPKYGLDVNLVNEKGDSPLKLARELKYAGLEKLLLKLGAKE